MRLSKHNNSLWTCSSTIPCHDLHELRQNIAKIQKRHSAYRDLSFITGKAYPNTRTDILEVPIDGERLQSRVRSSHRLNSTVTYLLTRIEVQPLQILVQHIQHQSTNRIKDWISQKKIEVSQVNRRPDSTEFGKALRKSSAERLGNVCTKFYVHCLIFFHVHSSFNLKRAKCERRQHLKWNGLHMCILHILREFEIDLFDLGVASLRKGQLHRLPIMSARRRA